MQVPEGYFNGFAESVMQKIRAAEGSLHQADREEELSEILQAVSKLMPYKIPVGYMDSFSVSMLEKVRPAKVISMRPKRSVFQYAAAAVVTGLLGLGIFNGMNNKQQGPEESTQKVVFAEARNILSTNSFEQTLKSIPAEDIVNYLENIGQDVDAALVAVAATEPGLPEPVDYLIDESTLENFLKDLDPKTLN